MEKGIKEKRKQLLEKLRVEKWFQRDNLIIIILSGVLLLVIAWPTKTDNRSISDSRDITTAGESPNLLQKETDPIPSAVEESKEAYERKLEKRLKAILEVMEGVGEVEVMITLASSEELVVEKDRPIVRSNTTENDSEGGSRSIYQTDSKETTVYSNAGNDSEPYVIKTLTPKIEGVLVAAKGAGYGEVSKNITEAVQALFDLDAHKIKVVSLQGSKD